MVVGLHVVDVQPSQMTDIDGGMAPEEQASASLVPFPDDGSGELHHFGHVPYSVLANTFQVAEPEEHAEWFDVANALHVAEIHILSSGIIGLQPQPSRSLVVVALLHEFFRSGIDTEESNGGLAYAQRRADGQRSALIVDGYQRHTPCITGLHVGDGVIGGSTGQCLADGALAIGGSELDARCIGGGVPFHLCIVSTWYVHLAHLHATNARSTLTDIIFHHTIREIGAVGQFEDILERNVGRYILLREGIAIDHFIGSQCTVAIDGHLHLSVLCRPCPYIVVPLQRSSELRRVGRTEHHCFTADIFVLTSDHEKCKHRRQYE